MNKFGILISSCGRRVQLIETFREQARALNIEAVIVGCDVEPEFSPATEFLDACFRVPRCDSPEFAPTLLRIAREQNIKLIIPTIDPEIPIFAAKRAEFEAVGAAISVSNEDVCRVACDKIATYDWACKTGIRTPYTCSIAEARASTATLALPLVVKPVAGSGSVGVRKIESVAELYDQQYDRNFLIQEFVEGIEFTVNMYFGLNDGLPHCVIPHRRLEVRSGEVSKGVTVKNARLEEMGWNMAKQLKGARGCICFQAIETPDGRIYLIEVNARFGGGFPLAYMAGGVFSKWLIEDVMRLPSSANNVWQDGVFMLRYDNAVFLKN